MPRIRLHPAAATLLNFLAEVWLTGKGRIHHGQNVRINDWCDYWKSWFIIPRPVPWE
jgi:hypothetical protein